MCSDFSSHKKIVGLIGTLVIDKDTDTYAGIKKVLMQYYESRLLTKPVPEVSDPAEEFCVPLV